MKDEVKTGEQLNRKPRILIAEGEMVVATDIECMLARLGYDSAGIVTSGEEVLQGIDRARPDLVLMDIRLAGELDGIETGTRIHERYDIPVVYLTGHAEEPVLPEAKLSDSFGYVGKPVREGELRATIEMTFHHHDLEQKLRASQEHLAHSQRLAHLGSYQFEVPEGEVVWSDETFHIVGRNPEKGEPSIEEYYQIIHPDDLLYVQRVLGESYNDMKPFDFEYRIIREDGSTRHIHSVGEPIGNGGGVVVRVVGTIHDITERKQAEEALRESEKRHRRLLEALQEGIWVIDKDACTALINVHMAEMLGYTVDEMLGKHLFSFMDESGVEIARRNLKQRRLGVREQHEFEFLHKDGTRVHTLLATAPFTDDAGNYDGAIAGVLDITDRKRTERKLQELMKRLLRAQRVARMGFLDCNLKTNEMTWSDHIYDLYGVEKMVEQSNIDLTMQLVHPDDQELVDSHLEMAIKGEKEYDIDHRKLRSDGKVVWVHAQAELVRDADGNPESLLGTVVDITERKLAEEALVERERYHRSLMHSLHEDILVIDREYRITDVNHTFLVTTGHDHEEVIGHHCFEVLHGYGEPCEQHGEECKLREVFETGVPAQCFHTHTRVDGPGAYVNILLSPLKDDDGHVTHVIEAVRDVTDLMLAQEALRESEREHRFLFDTMIQGFAHHQIVLDEQGKPIDYVFLNVNRSFEELTGLRSKDALGKRVTEVLPGIEDDPADWIGTYGKVALGGDAIWLEQYSGSLKRWYAVFVYSPTRLQFVTLFHDITERKRAEEVQRKSERELRIRDQVNTIFLAYPDERMYAELLSVIREVMESEFGTFGYFDEDGSFVGPAVTREIYWDKCNVPEKDIIFRKGTFGGIWVRAIEERRTVVSNDGTFKTPEGHVPIRNAMATPIIFRGELISAFHVANKPNGYDERDRRTLETIADQIAPVLYARLQRDRQRKEREQAEQQLRLHGEIMENLAEGVYLVRVSDVVIVYTNATFHEMFGYGPDEMVGKHASIVNAPTEKSPIETADEIMAVLRKTGVWRGEVHNIRKDGTPFWCYANVSTFDHPEYGRILVAVHTDITERKQAEEDLRRSLEETARGQRLLLALSQAAQTIQRARTPDEVYESIWSELAALGYTATVFALTDDGERLSARHVTFDSKVLRVAEKLTGLSAEDYSFPLVPDGFYHRILSGGEAIFSDPAAEPIAEALPARVRPLAARLAAVLGLEQAIYVPLSAGGKPHGLLTVVGSKLTEADVPAVVAFANQAGIAIENARLLERVRASSEQMSLLAHQVISAQEEERRRISQDLHDELGQTLTAVAIDLAAVKGALPEEIAPVISDRLAEAISLTERMDEQVSEMALDLRPSVLDDLGLVPALHWHLSRYETRVGIKVDLAIIGLEERLSSEMETALYRIVQEALTNVAKHARATRVSVRLERQGSSVVALIEDDGRGFDVEEAAGDKARARGAGLLGIQERVASLGGTASIKSRPEQGTRLRVEMPV